jgi:cytochrome c nitrite reductase small subunit
MKLLLATLAGLLLGLGGYTAFYAKGSAYLSDDPQGCVNCHIMREAFDGWQNSSHHAHATCNDCHVPHDFLGKWAVKASNGYHHSRAFTLQDFHEPIRIRSGNAAVLNANCLRCHGEFVSEITAARVHGDADLACARCHAGAGHRWHR